MATARRLSARHRGVAPDLAHVMIFLEAMLRPAEQGALWRQE